MIKGIETNNGKTANHENSGTEGVVELLGVGYVWSVELIAAIHPFEAPIVLASPVTTYPPFCAWITE